MNIFIDTNIYLTFYHFTNDDIEELKKIIVAIEGGKLKVYLPEQVVKEFKRNRENKITQALKILDEQKIPDRFPQLIKDYPEYRDLFTAKDNFISSKNILMAKLKEDIKNKSLGADKIINDLFSKAIPIPTTGELLNKAKERSDIGNPPGKSSSYGDAINWECLLSNVGNEEDLYIIARDNDYVSPIDESLISTYLKDEWEEKKKSKVTLYSSLSEFFRSHFPDIKLATEMEKEIAISNLSTSSNFASTHKAIARLKQFTDFTEPELNQIVDAGIENNQIFAIAEDDDVKEFYSDLVEERGEHIEDKKLEELQKIYMGMDQKEDFDEIPF